LVGKNKNASDFDFEEYGMDRDIIECLEGNLV